MWQSRDLTAPYDDPHIGRSDIDIVEIIDSVIVEIKFDSRPSPPPPQVNLEVSMRPKCVGINGATLRLARKEKNG
jgi:hypothetical protein